MTVNQISEFQQLKSGARFGKSHIRLSDTQTNGLKIMISEQDYERRILIIDDNEAIHKDFRRVLLSQDEENSKLKELERQCFGEPEEGLDSQSINMSLEHALQGEEGLQKLVAAVEEGKPFDLAFVDMRMPPGWDGLQTIQELWKVDPELEVVICTAYSDHSWHDILERLGQSDHLLILRKPFDVIEIQQMALGLTEKRRLSRLASLKMETIANLVVSQTQQLREEKLNAETMLQDLLELVGQDADIPQEAIENVLGQ